VSYATKGTPAAATPPAAGAAARTGSKKKLISSSARTSVTSDSDTIERLQEEVRAPLFAGCVMCSSAVQAFTGLQQKQQCCYV
jgi:hypothetical protein